MRKSIIVAMDEKRGIGRNNKLLFKISEDFERMRSITRNHPVIMGRKTFESIGRILPTRTNIVVTRDAQRVRNVNFYSPEVKIAPSLIKGIEQAKKSPGSDEIFIFGGGRIFAEALKRNLVDKLYLTIVEGDFDADTFFPDYSDFKKIIFEKEGEPSLNRRGRSEGYKYKFLELER